MSVVRPVDEFPKKISWVLAVVATPAEIEGLWEGLYVGSAMNSRHRLVINAIGALDIALRDLRGKALGRPCYELLGEVARESVIPYASLQPETSSFDQSVEHYVSPAGPLARQCRE